jgi:two-component sensor histidine kinase
MKIFRYLFILTIFISTLLSNNIEVTSENKRIDILSKSEIYIDENNTNTFEDIKKQTFIKNNKILLNLGLRTNKSIWIKFTLENISNKKETFILEYASAIVSNIEFYNKNNISYDGLLQLNKNRNSLRPSFTINLEAQEKQTYYLKAFSKKSILVIKLNLWNNKDFENKKINHAIIVSLFFGAIIILFIYNLFLLIFTKDIVYLYYILYIFFVSFHHSIYIGYSSLYIFNQSILNFTTNNITILTSSSIIFMTLFSQVLLNLNRFKVVNKVMNIHIILIILITLISINNEYFHSILLFIYILLIILLISSSIYCLFKKEVLTIYYLIAWVPLLLILIGWIYVSISKNSLVQIYEIFPYILEATILFEAVIFSVALAFRINILQKNKEELNTKFLSHQKNQKEILKQEVNKKTSQLNLALEEKNLLLKELHHRVKNNMQMIISLLRLQSNGILDKDIKDIFSTAQNRVSAMAYLHELLYKQNNMTYINALDYFTVLIDKISKTSNKKVTIRYEINTNINVEQVIYCALILNELISNSFKYAFENEGEISIYLDKKKSYYIFKISDNGRGYKRDKNKKTLGLNLINTLVKNQLLGSIETISNKGTITIIKWRDNEKS